MASEKTYEEINAKIKKGTAVVVTAEEIISIAKEMGLKKAAEKVDVVTTGTFGIMCSSGAFLNFGHTKPKMKMSRVWLNDVAAYGGLAAVDAYLGATEVREGDPLNNIHPGEFIYGGGHVLEDLVAGKTIKMRATAYGTDCYPLRKFEKLLTISDLHDAILYSPRNCYQNYNVGVNLTSKTIYTYMGILRPRMANANYSGAGQLSPLINDPYYKTVGIGTRIFLGGGIGYVAGAGTQHDPGALRNDKGIPLGGAGTLAVTGDMKQMNHQWLRGVSVTGYGTSLMTGIGIPIPILNEEILEYTTIEDKDIQAPLIDYGSAYPNAESGNLGYVNFDQLKSGSFEYQGKQVKTAPLSSYPRALEIAETLKQWILNSSFYLGQPSQTLPTAEGKEEK